MPGFESIIGQSAALEILTTLIHKGNIPHALLFYGINGVGKRAAAVSFSMALNCHGDPPGSHPSKKPCGKCRSCGKIQSGNHPDVIHIKPSGQFIRIAQIRELLDTLSLKPYEAVMRVVVVLGAHTMNPEASNALLKMLEEPPDQTIFILTTEQRVDLLPTVVSRCQQIRFRPVPREYLKQMLKEAHSLSSGAAQIVCSMANGSQTKAVEMVQENWMEKRNWLIDEVEALPSKPMEALTMFAERLSNEKAALMDSLDILMSWFRDVLIYRFDTQKILNKDLKDRIQSASERLPTDVLLLKIKQILQTQRNIRANANLRLALDTLIFQLAEV